MRRISAHYVITGEGDILKRGVVTVTSEGEVSGLETLDDHSESPATEFYNGVLIPGFVNCHCHLELSHLKGTISRGTGLGGFIRAINATRQADDDEIVSAASLADREMYNEGIVACGDISNKTVSFDVKAKSNIEYVTFIEIFGAVPGKSQKRLSEVLAVRDAAVNAGLTYHLTPHSVYSVSRALFAALTEQSGPDAIFSMHFLESPDERLLTKHHCGPMLRSYEAMGITAESMDVPEDHLKTAITLTQHSSNLILVHNTAVTKEEVETLVTTGKVSWCMCPSSNLYITHTMPPATMIYNAGGKIVIGTDSLSSTDRLSILNELYLLQEGNPGIALEKMIQWATINGAKALAIDKRIGSITPGKKPGLLLIEDMDLPNMKLLSNSRVRRLL